MSISAGGVAADQKKVGAGDGAEGVPWPTGADGYKLDKMIGKGAFATVWKAFCVAREVHVAVKVMDLENVTHSFEDIRQEVGVFDRVRLFVCLPRAASVCSRVYLEFYLNCEIRQLAYPVMHVLVSAATVAYQVLVIIGVTRAS